MITMIKRKGVNMKRLIALLAIVALSITLFSPPVAATCPDPSKPVPWMDPSVTPEGDDVGWNDITSIGGDGHASLMDGFSLHILKYLIVYFIPKSSGHNDIRDTNDLTDNRVVDGSRRASSN
jgi:hypothetical protein